MDKMLLVYAHLIATCMAIGVIVMTDMRLLAKLARYKVVIPPPERFETRMIMVALTALVLSGGTIIALGLATDPNYLNNPKLQAKLMLVAILSLNAVVLHYVTFPRLARARPVASWNFIDHLAVAIPVGLSNSLWFYCAFLGIARAWSYKVSMEHVLTVAGVLASVTAFSVLIALRFAARDEPVDRRPDLIDTVKSQISSIMGLEPYR